MTSTLPSGMPALPEPARTAYVEGPAMQGGEYRTLSDSYEPDCAMYSPNQVREIQAAAFAAGRAEGGKDALDAARYRLMRENIDYTEDPEDGSGYYWHNQRGEFSYVIAGGKRPSFEEVIDAALPTPHAAISQEPK